MAGRKKLLIAAVIVMIAGAAVYASSIVPRFFFKPTTPNVPAAGSPTAVTIVDKLSVPWGMAVLPDKDMLVTERPGTLRRIGQNGQTHVVDGVAPVGEGGLLGLALDPDFASNKYLYLYSTTRNGSALTNHIERYAYDGDTLTRRQVIFDGIAGAANHDGGRIAFGPDGYLYVTTGDAGTESNAQDRGSLNGKILRLTHDGQPAPGNPFGTAVYSYGHRNPQGLAWDDRGRLWETEHGRSGASSGYDELNLIKPGGNYGWPLIQGDESRAGMIPPVANSGPDDTWAPGGLAYVKGSLYFGGLRGQTLYRATIQADDSVKLSGLFREQYGRLRTTLVSSDTLYVTTSNTDGRGSPKPGDDRLVQIRL